MPVTEMVVIEKDLVEDFLNKIDFVRQTLWDSGFDRKSNEIYDVLEVFRVKLDDALTMTVEVVNTFTKGPKK